MLLDTMAVVSSMCSRATTKADMCMGVFVTTAIPALPPGAKSLVSGLDNKGAVNPFDKGLMLVVS